MPDYAAGIMQLLQNGPGPLPPEQKAQIDAWLAQKQQSYERAAPGDARTPQWLEHDKAKYTQHANELVTHAAAAEAMKRGKTMLIGLLGLAGQANKVTPPERPTNRQDLGVQPWPTSSK